jgi:hypothetical protein
MIICAVFLAALCIPLLVVPAAAATSEHPDIYDYPYNPKTVCYKQVWSCDDVNGCRYIDAVCHPCEHPGNPDPLCKSTVTTKPDSPYEPPYVPPDEEHDIPWVVIIGGLAVAGIAAVAISKGLGKKKPGEKEEKKGTVRYILQITPTDTIKVGPNKPGSFTATAWKVDEKGVPSQAGNATITIVPPAGIPGLSVAPASGMGSVIATVSLDRPAGVDTAQIKVTASVGGKGISANITVTFEAETKIEFD